VDQVVSDCEVGAGCARANAAITVIKTVKMKSFISMSILVLCKRKAPINAGLAKSVPAEQTTNW
jgi:hypothetical protein